MEFGAGARESVDLQRGMPSKERLNELRLVVGLPSQNTIYGRRRSRKRWRSNATTYGSRIVSSRTRKK